MGPWLGYLFYYYLSYLIDALINDKTVFFITCHIEYVSASQFKLFMHIIKNLGFLKYWVCEGLIKINLRPPLLVHMWKHGDAFMPVPC